jgi:hypothetical protein
MVQMLPAVPAAGRCAGCGRQCLTAFCDGCAPPARAARFPAFDTSVADPERPGPWWPAHRHNGHPLYPRTSPDRD